MLVLFEDGKKKKTVDEQLLTFTVWMRRKYAALKWPFISLLTCNHFLRQGIKISLKYDKYSLFCMFAPAGKQKLLGNSFTHPEHKTKQNAESLRAADNPLSWLVCVGSGGVMTTWWCKEGSDVRHITYQTCQSCQGLADALAVRVTWMESL